MLHQCNSRCYGSRRADKFCFAEDNSAIASFPTDRGSDHVLVCQPNDDDLAFMGELSAEVLQQRGLIGYVTDGGCRDVEIIKKSSFPVYCRYHTPIDIVGKWIPQELGEPIRIGHVAITTGDFLLADTDGIVVLPSQHLTTVLEKTEVIINTENQMRKAIRGGMKPQAAYLKYKKF